MTVFEKYFDVTHPWNAPHFAAVQKRPKMPDADLQRIVGLFGHDVKYLYFLLRFQNVVFEEVELLLAGFKIELVRNKDTGKFLRCYVPPKTLKIP